MDRRSFLKTTALAGAAAALPGALQAAARKADTAASAPANTQISSLSYRADGTFKILQLTDTHYISGDKRSKRALDNVCSVLDAEKPDLVIHTGDVIFGRPARKSLHEILDPIAERGIPFAVAQGNHDSEFGLTRDEIMAEIRTIPGCLNTNDNEGLYGSCNDIITLKSAGGATDRVLYIFDSSDYIKIEGLGGYDYIHSDQIDWYKKNSAAFREANSGSPVKSFAFFHIPVPEFRDAISNSTKRILRGNFGEEPCSPSYNSGLFINMKEQGDVQAIFCGHDHDDDFAMLWQGMFMIYGRYSGCDTVYNNLKPNGCRVILLREGDSAFQSWIRLCDGTIEQKLHFPDSFKDYSK